MMPYNRRDLIKQLLMTAAAGAVQAGGAGAQSMRPGIPGPFPGRVIAVEHPGSIAAGSYQPDAIRQVMQRGMAELTGAPSWQDGWRSFFRKGDVVGIKVSPVGGPRLSSDGTVLRNILDGLEQCGISGRDVIVFSRYRDEIVQAGIDKWIPDGIRWDGASRVFDPIQLGMEGYDPDHYMDMALVKPGENVDDPHHRRSYVASIVTRQVNKVINVPVLKHHQSAGVTIALKNISHGCVNNVSRSHFTPTSNACGVFIPSVVNLPVFREKVVLHIVDGVKAAYHGGPGGNPKYIWEHKTMYFGTDPVAIDKTGWQAIDARRKEAGMLPIALSKPDDDSHYLNCQVEHIELAGMLGLGRFADEQIQVRRIRLT